MEITDLSVATVRSLGIDMINRANSGHPGMVIGSAPALYTLFTKELNVNPKNPQWFNRDRFVLASGHACALLYSLLHLSGYELSLDDLKAFRQWQSITPGHPEYRETPGVDASSGPLGQGIPMAVGMALAEKALSTRFNKPDLDIVDHYTYVLCGDGDMQEGVTYEACSLAGHYSLGKLIIIYDANKVTLDGPLDLSFSEDVKKRFLATGFEVIEVDDGNDLNALAKAIKKAKRNIYKPTLIINNTIIGYGSKNQGTSAVHGNPLGQEDGKNTKLSYGFDHEDFYVPEEVYEHFNDTILKHGKKKNKKWDKMLKLYQEQYPELYTDLMRAINDDYELDFEAILPKFEVGHSDATRNTSQQVINAFAPYYKSFMAGAADLSGSTKSNISNEKPFLPGSYDGRNIYYGIREFAMVSIMNGITLHTGLRVASGAFMVFSDYLKAGLRMACLMKLPIVLVLSHDSIAVGEDGPTHQPIEQLPMLRSMINMQVIRPCDANETVAAWRVALETKDRPTALLLTRQNVTTLATTSYEGLNKGAYIVGKEEKQIDAIIIATGSEVNLAMDAKKELLSEGIDVRVVSMPSMDLFERQSKEYKESILPSDVRKRLSIEMASDFGWGKYVGLDGLCMSINTFGASAPANDVIKNYGFTVEKVKENIYKLLK